MVELFRFYFSPNGRISRSAYWRRMALPFFVIGAVARVVDWAMGWRFGSGSTDDSGYLEAFVSLMLLWPGLAIQIKRLHDSNRTGWWIAAAWSCMAAAGAFAAALAAIQQRESSMLLAGCIIVPVLLMGLYFLGIRPGDKKQNSYGPDPLNPTDGRADVFA